MNVCPKCGKENHIEIKQACRSSNCESRILFNILKITCKSCKKEYYSSVVPVMTAKMEEDGDKK